MWKSVSIVGWKEMLLGPLPYSTVAVEPLVSFLRPTSLELRRYLVHASIPLVLGGVLQSLVLFIRINP